MGPSRWKRRSEFREGVEVRLSDDAAWTLPAYDASQNDLEYETLIEAALRAEDHTEQLRNELALTIALLTRNYNLSPNHLSALLSFPPDDPRLSALQDAVHDLVVRSATLLRVTAFADPNATDKPRPDSPDPGPTWEHWFRAIGLSRTT